MSDKIRIAEKIVTGIDYRNMIRGFGNHHEGEYVVTGPIAGSADITNRIGRVVQVRKEAGDFGSDIVLLRSIDGGLSSHANQSYIVVTNPKHREWLDGFFNEITEDYAEPYTIGVGDPETGFLIESKVPEGETTPMRDIKAAITGKIDDFIRSEV